MEAVEEGGMHSRLPGKRRGGGSRKNGRSRGRQSNQMQGVTAVLESVGKTAGG